tara:strand:- start:308 stop:1465 length:1158 start_codon:yes stop_codon:yes gene_type:complete
MLKVRFDPQNAIVLFMFVPAFSSILYLYVGILAIAAFYAVILCLFLVSTLNKLQIPKASFIVYMIIATLVGMKVITDVSEDSLRIGVLNFTNFILWGGAGLLVSGVRIDDQRMSINYGYKCGWVALITLVCVILVGGYGVAFNYMRFGYALLPTVLFAMAEIYCHSKFKLFPYALLISSTSLMIIFGSRGSVLVLVGALLIFVGYGGWLVRLISTLVLTVTLFFSSTFGELLKIVISMLGAAGYESYFLSKASMMAAGVDANTISSGRLAIYSHASRAIESSPFWGESFGFAYQVSGVDYLHNIVLDLASNFGLILASISVFMVFLLVFFSIKASQTRASHALIVVLCALGMGRLLVSSSIWLRPEFWFVFFFLLASCIRTNRSV